MPKRSSTLRDLNQIARAIVEAATAELSAQETGGELEVKNPAAVELGRLGGLKGGHARAAKLSKKRRSEIAKKAAKARWKKAK